MATQPHTTHVELSLVLRSLCASSLLPPPPQPRYSAGSREGGVSLTLGEKTVVVGSAVRTYAG